MTRKEVVDKFTSAVLGRISEIKIETELLNTKDTIKVFKTMLCNFIKKYPIPEGDQ